VQLVNSTTIVPPVIGGIAKLIARGFGLTAEGVAAAKASKAQKRSQNSNAVLASSGESSIQCGVIEQSNEYTDDKKTVESYEALLDSPEDDDDDPPPVYDNEEEDGEADWALDYAAGESDDAKHPTYEEKLHLESIPSSDEGRKHYLDKIVHSFVSQHSSPSTPRSIGQLPCPVIIP